jgi:hypothetical protein
MVALHLLICGIHQVQPKLSSMMKALLVHFEPSGAF